VFRTVALGSKKNTSRRFKTECRAYYYYSPRYFSTFLTWMPAIGKRPMACDAYILIRPNCFLINRTVVARRNRALIVGAHLSDERSPGRSWQRARDKKVSTVWHELSSRLSISVNAAGCAREYFTRSVQSPLAGVVYTTYYSV